MSRIPTPCVDLGISRRSLDKAGGNARLALAGYNGGIGVISRGEWSWAAETVRYVKYGFPIYEDARGGVSTSAALERMVRTLWRRFVQAGCATPGASLISLDAHAEGSGLAGATRYRRLSLALLSNRPRSVPRVYQRSTVQWKGPVQSRSFCRACVISRRGRSARRYAAGLQRGSQARCLG